MNKNSFILYTEQREVIDKLTDEQAGKLIKAIYQYVDTNEMPELDNTLSLVIIPIKQNLDKNKEKYEKISKIRAEAGAKGGKQKKQMQAKKSKCYDNDNDNDNVNVNDKEKENKKKKSETKTHFAEFVSMTNAEHEKLVSTYGVDFTDQCVKVLDNYKGSSGKKYKSDYRAILSWVIDRVTQDNTKQKKKNNYKQRDYSNLNFLYANKGGTNNENNSKTTHY